MSNAFFEIAFTPGVKAMQEKMGSRAAYGVHGQTPAEDAVLGPAETAFITARDSFYQATVSETGWPYVQHRGGPAGFLKVLDERTLGYADFSGNRQYISTGNLNGDDRVCLFLMDYPHQARLKILGRARIVDEAGDAALFARLDNQHSRARVERGVVIQVEAFDWNCPKYITPRYTRDEIAARIQEAKAAQAAPVEAAPIPVAGDAELSLVVSGIRQLTPRIRAYELRTLDGAALPQAAAGAHVEVPVRLADGTLAIRQYSLVRAPAHAAYYEIAVLREDDGRGGSQAIHQTWQIGTSLRLARPRNHFPLHTDARPAVLLAGGIGITPITAMAHTLRQSGRAFELHYTARTPGEMAYRDELAEAYGAVCRFYYSRVPGQPRLDLAQVIGRAPRDAVYYVCGPAALISAVHAAAEAAGIAPERVQHESFV